ncbi:TraB/GumN family protein [Desulfovibrio sp. OttesenSCG-928-F07]|nr:TraB/GumN family protein [Desulfovibrio sp. OttesenSCG-928-F07]
MSVAFSCSIPVYTVKAGDNPATVFTVQNGPQLSWAELSPRLRVPEHSVPFMQGMSSGTAIVVNNHLFFKGEDWLTAIGYPLLQANGSEAPYDLSSFITAADIIGDHMLLQNSGTGANKNNSIDIFAVAPALPAQEIEKLGGSITEQDNFYILPADAETPTPLRRLVRKAAELLQVNESTEFTAEHRKLWSEILTRPNMRPAVREMYAKTGWLMQQNLQGLKLLNAWDNNGKLAAALLIDYYPERFCSYIIGAHSRRNYTAYATDLLFDHLLKKAKEQNKNYIHLGLGVNEGILRFKTKWGAVQDLPFVAANWQHQASSGGVKGLLKELTSGLVGAITTSTNSAGSTNATGSASGNTTTTGTTPATLRGSEFANPILGGAGLSKQQIFNAMPTQRPYAMLWQLEKNGKTSWIGGTAHFFYYSFTDHFEKLFEQVDNVIFEGPMDEESMRWFTNSGQSRLPDDPDLLAMLSPKELNSLKYMVQGSPNRFMRFLRGEKPNSIDVEYYLKNYRPWYAFFSMWTAFLERNGWQQSVDLDAWNLAHERGKAVIAMETHEEQMASLSSVPPERIINFFRQCKKWPQFSRKNINSYLLGNLGGMYGTSTEFPTLGVRGVFSVRDVRFTERMMPFVEQGRSITFVGSAHMLGMRSLLQQAGVKVTKVYPSRRHKLKCEFLKRVVPDRCDFE